MKIATWNLERGGASKAARVAQEDTLRALGADVAVLTEPPASYVAGPGVVVSPRLRPGPSGLESWVAIVGPGVEEVPLAIPFERLAVAARVVVGPRRLCVYGSVLPWLAVRAHAPGLVREGETFADVFARVLSEQKADLQLLSADHDLVFWAGDFNQSLEGPNHGGSTKGREGLTKCLGDLGLVAFNRKARHAVAGMSAIDLLCGPSTLAIRDQGRIEPVRGGVVMSDHAGYWIDLDP